MPVYEGQLARSPEVEAPSNPARHRIAALWREGMKLKGRVRAARGALRR